MVTFADGTSILGTARLRAGKAVLTTSVLAIGRNAIEASYSGNQQLAASQSAIRIESITADRTAIALFLRENDG